MKLQEDAANNLATPEESGVNLEAIMAALNAFDQQIELGYAEFVRICEVIPEKDEADFLGFFAIDSEKGVSTDRLLDHSQECITSEDAAFWLTHPQGKDLSKPVLPFPFTIKEFKKFFQWSLDRAIDVPIDLKALTEIAAENGQESAPPEDADVEPKRSDLLAIAGLLGLLLKNDRPRYKNAAGMIATAIESNGWYGASHSQLTKLFPKAKKAVLNADEQHQPCHLLVIAGLLELLQDDDRPRYEPRTAADAIAAKGWKGVSSGQVTVLFDQSMVVACEANKEAKTPKIVKD